MVWLLRHPELFSSEVITRDPRQPYPPIQASDMETYHFVQAFFGDFFLQHDRPAHTEMRKVVHGSFTPKSMEKWRALVQSAITTLLDEVEAQGHMDVMRDFATPLPLLVIAPMLAHARWVATRRGLDKPVSSSPPFKTGRARMVEK